MTEGIVYLLWFWMLIHMQMMLRTKEGRIIWCEREYLDHIETKLDTNEYIFSVNE